MKTAYIRSIMLIEKILWVLIYMPLLSACSSLHLTCSTSVPKDFLQNHTPSGEDNTFSMEFSDDGSHLLLWSNSVARFYDVSPEKGSVTLSSTYSLTPQPWGKGINIRYAHLAPLYGASQQIPSAFARLRKAVKYEYDAYKENEAAIKRAGRASYDKDRMPMWSIGSYHTNDATIYLLEGDGPRFFARGNWMTGKVAPELMYHAASISLNKDYLIAFDYDVMEYRSGRFQIFHRGDTYWEVFEKEYSKRRADPSKSHKSYSYVSPTGQFAFLHFGIECYSLYGFVVPGYRVGMGIPVDKHIYMLVDVRNKRLLHVKTRKVVELTGPRGRVCVAIDEVNRRIAIFNANTQKLKIMTFDHLVTNAPVR